MSFARLKVLWHTAASCFNPPRCQHPRWRPAIKDHAPAKWCSQCGVSVNIKETEFYALFGRPSYAVSETPFDLTQEHR